MSYVVRNEFGAFCSVCQSPLSMEEDDWDCCDACGGDGIGDDNDAEDEELMIDAAERARMSATGRDAHSTARDAEDGR